MERVKIKNTLRFFSGLTNRLLTRRIVIHHTGIDGDWDAKTINQWHLDNGWSCIGYHFVIRKNGQIESGRPVDAVGAHAYGYNYDSIGIHLSGEFSIVKPTDAQIESCAMLIANLAADYNIPIDRKHIVGHRELGATDCPGKQLFDLLPIICGKANFYRYC